MTILVDVQSDLLKRAMARMVERMPEIADVLVRRTAFAVVADVTERVPVDTGRYRAGWRAALDVLSDDTGEGDGVSVFVEGEGVRIEVTNPVEYGPYIEYGTASTPPGNHLALALETARRELPELPVAEIDAAWQEST